VRPFHAGAPSSTFPRYAISSDGRLLAHGQADGAVSLVDTRTLTISRSFPVTTADGAPPDKYGNVPAVDGMQFIPGSHLLVVGGDGGFLALVDADSGRVLKRLRGHTDGVWTPGISADGHLMVTAGGDGTVRLFSLPDGRQLGAPLHFDQQPVDAQLSPDGRWFTVIDGGDTFDIYDARTRRLAHRIPAEAVYGARFSHDGRWLAVGDQRGRAQLYSTATWRPVTRAFTDHLGTVDIAVISPDGRTLVTGAQDGTLRLWDVPTQQLLGTPLPGLPGQRVIPIFAPDGRALYAAYSSGNAYRWDIRTASLIRQACQVAGRRLTRAEWEQVLPGRAYDPAC
jgi:WD40 repeat protein